MKRAFLLAFLAVLSTTSVNVFAETETIDLKALAKKARPSVMLLVVSDAAGKEIATGTGFLVSSDGKLITNHHVIEGASSAVAKAESGGLFPVEGVLADDPKNDLVLLKLKGKDLPFLTLGSSDKIEVGTRIAVIGSPLGLEGTVSEGIVSAVRGLTNDMRILQITAAVSPGSSGSPVLNGSGAVVGVATALLRDGQSLNFAVPVERAIELTLGKPSSTPPTSLSAVRSNGEEDVSMDRDWVWYVVAKAKEDYTEALTLIKGIVARHPKNPEGYSQLATVFSLLHFYEDAARAQEAAVQLAPDDAEQWHKLGVQCYLIKKWAEAVNAQRQAIKIWPDYLEAWDWLGETYWQLGDEDESKSASIQTKRIRAKLIEINRRTVMRDPGNKLAWSYLVSAFKKQGDLNGFVSLCKEVLKTDPTSKEAWNQLGLICDYAPDQKHTYVLHGKNGVEHKVEALEVVPADVLTEILAKIDDGKGSHTVEVTSTNNWCEQGREYCKSAIRKNYDNALAWDAYESLTLFDFESLLAFCSECALVQPEKRPLWDALLRGVVGRNDKNRENDAVALAQTVIGRNAKSVRARIAAGRILFMQAKYREAQDMFEEIVRLDVTEAEGWLGLWGVHRKTGQAEKAKTAFDKVRELNQKLAEEQQRYLDEAAARAAAPSAAK